MLSRQDFAELAILYSEDLDLGTVEGMSSLIDLILMLALDMTEEALEVLEAGVL